MTVSPKHTHFPQPPHEHHSPPDNLHQTPAISRRIAPRAAQSFLESGSFSASARNTQAQKTASTRAAQ